MSRSLLNFKESFSNYLNLVEKVVDFAEQSSWSFSSAVGAYWKHWWSIFSHNRCYGLWPLRTALKATQLATGGIKRSSENWGFLIMNYKHTTCKPSDVIRGWLYKTARSHNKKTHVLINSKLQISTCSYLWMFFTKEGLSKKRKRSVA